MMKKIVNVSPRVQNVVCTIDLGIILDLKKIALKAKNTEFNSKRFHALVMRSRDPKATALIFKSGKMVCTGTKTENDGKEAITKFLKLIKQAGFYNAGMKNFQIRNIVATTDFKMPITLDAILYAYRNCCMYEPEIFPGLVLRPDNNKAVMIIFSSGKIVMTGLKSFDELKRMQNKLTQIMVDLKIFDGLVRL